MALTIEAPAAAAVSLLPESARRLLPVAITAGDATVAHEEVSRRLEITWTRPSPGRDALPLRAPISLGFEILDACRARLDRPISWCMIDWVTAESARLMDRLTMAWGAGIACLNQVILDDSDYGLSRAEAALVQSRSAVRAWWGAANYLDPFLVLESLRHGCLPVQCMPESAHGALVDGLPNGLREFTLAIPASGDVPQLRPEERQRRIDAGLSVILAGSLERDLARLIPATMSERT